MSERRIFQYQERYYASLSFIVLILFALTVLAMLATVVYQAFLAYKSKVITILFWEFAAASAATVAWYMARLHHNLVTTFLKNEMLRGKVERYQIRRIPQINHTQSEPEPMEEEEEEEDEDDQFFEIGKRLIEKLGEDWSWSYFARECGIGNGGYQVKRLKKIMEERGCDITTTPPTLPFESAEGRVYTRYTPIHR